MKALTRLIGFFFVASFVLGCGTTLVVSEQSPDTHPSGIAVNKRMNYSVTFEVPDKSPLPKVTGTKRISGVDHDDMLVLNIDRATFATGTLQVELSKLQTLKKVTVDSKAGLTNATGSLTKLLETDTALEDARAKQEEAEEDAADSVE